MEHAMRTTDAHSKPPFLFRAASDDTESNGCRGLNTVLEIDPLYNTESSYHHGIADIEYLQVRMMIYDHLKYYYRSPSEFCSWSMSLYFVLQHAIRRTWGTKSGGESKVLIYVMDTTSLPLERVRYAPELLKGLQPGMGGPCALRSG